MEQFKKKISFWNLIKGQKIVIPIIQRDYAQGRVGKEKLRQKFLDEIKSALDSDQKLTLDFVYGVANSEKSMLPLDGQQRLTTLWLLHWYLAYMTGQLGEVKHILKNFTYETRVSSREFCERLCDLTEKKDADDSNDEKTLLEHIQTQTWFYNVWKQDPTIQAMLIMLCGTKIDDEKTKIDIVDGLDELFKGYNKKELAGYFAKLTSENDSPILFYQMTIGTKEMPLSDDLYIKMNARGKSLTSFENFKADLVKWIVDNISEEKSVEYASLLDNVWTDIFWKEANTGKTHCVDESFFAFINRIFYNLVVVRRTKDGSKYELSDDNASSDKDYTYFNDTQNPNDLDRKVAYETFDNYVKYIDESFLQNLSKIFTNLKVLTSKDKVNDYFRCRWDGGFNFIPEYEESHGMPLTIVDNQRNEIYAVSTINQLKRVVFYAVCKFLLQDPVEGDNVDLSLERWMRFVWNIVSGTDASGREVIRSIRTMQDAIECIDMIDNPHKVYECLADVKDSSSLTTVMALRFKEEQVKAEQILLKESKPDCDGPGAKEIIEAEDTAFFRGSIRFLYTNADGNLDWNLFSQKLSNADKIFDDKGLREDYQAKANRIILSYCNNWLEQICSQPHHDKFIFGFSAPLWLNNILLKHKKDLPDVNLYSLPVHMLLTGEDVNCTLSLDGKEANSPEFKTFERLVKTDVIAALQERNRKENNYVRYIYNGYSLYPSSEGVILSQNSRDEVLYELIGRGDIEVNKQHEISKPEDKLLFGWDIVYKYKGHTFKWMHYSCVDMLDGETNLADSDADMRCYLNSEGEFAKHKFSDADTLVKEMDRCIAKYKSMK